MDPSTRPLLAALCVVALALPLAGCATPADTEAPAGRVLYVQDADAGTATPTGDGALDLVLRGIDPETLWFMDRPDRHAGILATSAFVASWPEGLDSFADDPPNAALLVHDARTGAREVFVVELEDPRYDAAKGELAYRARPIDAQEAFLQAHRDVARSGDAIPASFGEAELFIDAHFCELQADAQVKCWGENSRGGLGRP